MIYGKFGEKCSSNCLTRAFLILALTLASFFMFVDLKPTSVYAGSGTVYFIPVSGDVDRGLENFVSRGLDEARKSRADAVVLEQDAVVALFEFGGDQVAERLASRNLVTGESDVAADFGSLGQERGVGLAARDAEGDERRRMCVKHRF